MKESKEFLSARQVMEYLSISRQTLYRWNIPRIRVKRVVFYRKSDVEAWLDAHYENRETAT